MSSTTDDLQALVKAAPFIDIYLDAESPASVVSKADTKRNTKAETKEDVTADSNVGVLAEAKQPLSEILSDAEYERPTNNPIPPLPIGNIGSHADAVPTDLYPALLRAHIALAKVAEASRTMVLTDAPAKFLLLKAVHADRLLCNVPGDVYPELPLFLMPADSGGRHPIEDSARLLDKMSLRVRETGINKQLLTELAIKSGSARLLREGQLAQDQGIFSSGYTAADAAQLNLLVENWLEYVELSARNTDTLIVNAIAYHQFLSMSPFETGNSAAALAMFQLLLIDSGVVALPILAISENVLKHFDTHVSLFRTLHEQRNEVNIHQWLEHCVELISLSATDTLTRIHSCRAQAVFIRKAVADTLSGSHSDAVAQILIEQPVIRIRDLVDRGIAKRQTASVYLRKLCDAGVLKEQQSGKEKLFLNNSYLKIFNWDNAQPTHSTIKLPSII